MKRFNLGHRGRPERKMSSKREEATYNETYVYVPVVDVPIVGGGIAL